MKAAASSALAGLAFGELLLVRVTTGPLPAGDVACWLLGWALVLAMHHRTGHRAILPLATAALTSSVLLAPVADHIGPHQRLPAGVLLAVLTLAWGALAARAPRLLPSLGLISAALVVAGGLPTDLLLWASVLLAVTALQPRPLLALSLGAVAALPLPRRGLADGRPDIVLITVDALRADVADTLPLAPPWVRYSAWTPAPWTLPALASLMTARPPSEHHAGEGPGLPPLDPAWPTLAEAAAQAGYTTAALSGDNPFTGQHHGLLRGFNDVFHPRSPTPSPQPRRLGRHAPARPLFARLLSSAPPASDAHALVQRAQAFLEAHDEPVLLWLHLMDLHLPYADPPCRPDVLGGPAPRVVIVDDPWWTSEAGAACWKQSYTAAAQRIDLALTPWLGSLDPAHALVVLTADHGEALGDAGVEHGHTIAPEVSRIPMWVLAPWPRSDVDVDLTDLGHTLAATLGAALGGPETRDLRQPLAARPIHLGPGLYTAETGEVVNGCLWRRPTPDAAPIPQPLRAGACETPPAQAGGDR